MKAITSGCHRGATGGWWATGPTLLPTTRTTLQKMPVLVSYLIYCSNVRFHGKVTDVILMTGCFELKSLRLNMRLNDL